ncbi:hypothetical protein AA18889_0390 [Acetobacter senegalensis DSM 18889]|nr:hypothetical protein AA18889_0390 [Acetobacter senegalensis DSM 18889]
MCRGRSAGGGANKGNRKQQCATQGGTGEEFGQMKSPLSFFWGRCAGQAHPPECSETKEYFTPPYLRHGGLPTPCGAGKYGLTVRE